MATRTPPSQHAQQQSSQPATPHPASNHQSHARTQSAVYHAPADYPSALSNKLHPSTASATAPKAAMGAVKTGFRSGVLGVDSAMRSSDDERRGEPRAVSAGRGGEDRLAPAPTAPAGARRAPLGESKGFHANSHSPVTDADRQRRPDDAKRESKPLPHPPKIAVEEDVPATGVATPPQHTLSRPKSRLRLRLKLTPPHPPGTKVMEVPIEPVPVRPAHYNKVSPAAAAVHAPTATDEVVAGREYHYIRQQPSISTLNEHCFTRTSDVAASEADARTSKAMHQAGALSLVANNSPPSAVPAYRSASGASAKGKSQYSNKPPPPAASQRKRETTMVKRMLSTDGLRGKAVEMGKSLFSSGHSTSSFDMVVPGKTSPPKVKQASPPKVKAASPAKSATPPKTVIAAMLSKDRSPYPTPPDSACSTEQTKVEMAPSSASDPMATPRKSPPRKDSLRSSSVSTADGSAGPPRSATSSSGPSYMELSMTMSNSSRSTVLPDDEAAPEVLDDSLLRSDRDVSMDQPPRTPPRSKAASQDRTPEQASDDVFFPASDATPVRSARNVATGDVSASTDWSDLTPSKSRQAASSATHSSPFTYDSEDASGQASNKHAGDVSGVTTVSSQASPLAKKTHESSSSVVNDIFSLADQGLSDRYKFIEEIGFGNWGSVWVCKPRAPVYHPLSRLTKDAGSTMAASRIIAAQHHHSRVAVKLVHRAKTPTTAARVRALWSEMKVIRALRSDPHPSVVAFDSFVITPSYALIVMPYYAQLIPVNIEEDRTRSYFKQLASAVAYLHEKGITHNDLKPSNILLSYADVPVLVDFGFAQKWDLSAIDLTGTGDTRLDRNGEPHKQPFFSEISWGTPEYLDPPRARGHKHDERLSDVWSLGVTFFEILCGRTPFEVSEEEDFSTPEQLKVYYERTLTGLWIGDWSMSKAMEDLLKGMIQPNHAVRLSADEAHHHPALSPPPTPAITTPPFVRSAASMPKMSEKDAARRKERKEKQKSKLAADLAGEEAAAAMGAPAGETPVLLAESDVVEKDHTRQASPRAPARESKDAADKSRRSPLKEHPSANESPRHGKKDSGRTVLPVDGLASPIEEALRSIHNDANVTVRRKHARKPSDHKLLDAEMALLEIVPTKPAAAAAPVAAVMESHATVEKQANSVVRRKSIDELRRVTSREVILGKLQGGSVDPRAVHAEAKPARVPEAVQEHPLPDHSEALTATSTSPESKPVMTSLREKIIERDSASATRLRTTSGDLVRPVNESIKEKAVAAAAASEASSVPGAGASIDTRLDRIESWVKNVERIVQDTRLALNDVKQEQALPNASGHAEHSRNLSTLSTKVEPATPPRWKAFESDFAPDVAAIKAQFKPTHLKRQRSDLTGIRSKTFAVVAEEMAKPRPQTPLILGMMSQEPLLNDAEQARKLRSHRSLGDIGKLVSGTQDPYDRLLAERGGVDRYGEGYQGGSHRTAHHRRSGILGLFGKRDVPMPAAPPALPKEASRFKGWMKAAFGRHT